MPGTTTTTDFAARMVNGRKTYGKDDMVVHALDGIDVEIPRGKFTAVMGPSGSGKSTLLHTLAGLDVLTSGSSFIDDIELSALAERDITKVRRDNIGFIFQSFNLIPSLTGEENIRLPQDIARRSVDQEWFDSVIDVLGLRDRLDHLPAELSGGQQQRVAVARALVARPKIIFADEPSGNLDSRSGGELLNFLRRAVKEFGQTIVMVTHDPTAASYADSVLFLADGKIVDRIDKPTADSVLERMKSLGE